MERIARIRKMQSDESNESEWHSLSELVPSGDPQPLRPPMATLQILGGCKDKIRPGDVLGALTKNLGYHAGQIGKIVVDEFSTCVAVEQGIASDVLRGLNEGKVKGEAVKVRRL